MSTAPLTTTTPAARPDKTLHRPARPPMRLNFDSSVLGTAHMAGGTAVGYKLNTRVPSTYDLLVCSIAQTGKLCVSHRRGHAHDSNGIHVFIFAYINDLRHVLPSVIIKVRKNSASVSRQIIHSVEARGIQYTMRVPFERSARLTAQSEMRRPWHRVARDVAFLNCDWKRKCGEEARHFIFLRARELQQPETPVQLYLSASYAYEYHFKVLLPHATPSARALLTPQNGRGARDCFLAELQSPAQLDYIPCRRAAANQTECSPAVTAHSLKGRRQLSSEQPPHSPTKQPTSLRSFARLGIRRTLLRQRNGCLTNLRHTWRHRCPPTLSRNPSSCIT